MAQGGAAILIRGRGVGRPKVARRVKSITEQIQHTLNIAVTAGKGQPALRRVAPRRSPITTCRT
jgi:hypothetical protein